MLKTMVSVANLEKIEILEVKSLCGAKQGKNFWKKMIILGPKTAILGP